MVQTGQYHRAYCLSFFLARTSPLGGPRAPALQPLGQSQKSNLDPLTRSRTAPIANKSPAAMRQTIKHRPVVNWDFRAAFTRANASPPLQSTTAPCTQQRGGTYPMAYPHQARNRARGPPTHNVWLTDISPPRYRRSPPGRRPNNTR